jgi:hypothetical protein
VQLKSDFMGTEYTLWQPGGNPAGKKGFGAQGLAVNYKPSIKSVKGGPRTMMAALPVPDDKVWWGGHQHRVQWCGSFCFASILKDVR